MLRVRHRPGFLFPDLRVFPMIIAVDFDDTLFQYVPAPEGTTDYSGRPGSIGKPHYTLIQFLKNRRKDRDKLILWTCREGKALQDAVDACMAQGLQFDAVNANLPYMCPEGLWPDSRKVKADLYIDDKALKVRPWATPGPAESQALLDAKRAVLEEIQDMMQWAIVACSGSEK